MRIPPHARVSATAGWYQTVNGRTTCVSGGGGIVQEFGGTTGRTTLSEADDGPDGRAEIRPAVRTRRLSIEQRGPSGFLSLKREDGRLRLHREVPALGTD